MREIISCFVLICGMIAMYYMAQNVQDKNLNSCLSVLAECQMENLKNLENRKNQMECVVSKRCVDLIEAYNDADNK
jgi:hypothetical protein